MTPDDTHKAFRKYLRVEEGERGTMLSNLINAAEQALPALVQQYLHLPFGTLYDEHPIEQLLAIERQMNTDEIKAAHRGYTAWRALQAYIRFVARERGIDLNALPHPTEEQWTEGRQTEAQVLRRGRNRAAREQCLQLSGYTCYVCGFNFKRVYGSLGAHFLEVHHKRPLSTYDDEHPIPLAELCAVCSNCHSMIHRGKEPIDVDELREIVKEHTSPEA